MEPPQKKPRVGQSQKGQQPETEEAAEPEGATKPAALTKSEPSEPEGATKPEDKPEPASQSDGAANGF
jgi:hypothetical protein